MAEHDVSQSRLYEWLTGDDDSRMCDDIPESACDEQPHNFFLHVWASLGNKLADELSSARLVLPWLMGIIGAPVWMVGLLVPIRESGALLPQIFVAGFIRLKPRRKWVWVAGALTQACAALALAVLALFANGTLGGALVLAALVLLSLARGLSSIATKDVLGKTIAKRRRGTLMGWSGSIAGGATLAAGAVLMLFESRPGNLVVAILLVIAASGWLMNAIAAARIQEAAGAVEGGENGWDSIKLGLSLLKDDRTFLHFNVSRALLLSSALALPYIALLGQNQSGTDLGGAGHTDCGVRASRHGGQPGMGKTRRSFKPGRDARCSDGHHYLLLSGRQSGVAPRRMDTQHLALCNDLRPARHCPPRRAIRA